MKEQEHRSDEPSTEKHPSFDKHSALSRRKFLKSTGVTVSAGLLVGSKVAEAMNQGPTGNESPKVPLQIILVSTPQEANQILNQLDAGESFEKLARDRSIAPSASDGGFLGKIRISALQPEIQMALRGLSPGEVSSVITTPSGYMIVKILSEAAAIDLASIEHQRKLATAAQANVQDTTLVDGFSIVMHYFSHDPKPPNWNQNLETICQMQRHSVAQAARLTRGYWEEVKNQKANKSNASELMSRYESMAQFACFKGDMQKAIEYFQAEYQIASSTGALFTRHKLEEKLGIAYMFQGAIENLSNTKNIESSVFPIIPEAKYKLTSSEETCIKHFLRFLQREPSDLEVKWLLNIAYMKLGKYPASVPPEHLIPPAVFKSKEDVGRFANVAPSLGLDFVDISGGMLVDDFDNDGFLDVVASSFNACTPLRYFHNNGDGTFTDRSVESGLSKQLGGLNLIQADYNNDGWLDILVLRGAWQPAMRNSLLRNNGDGTFTDVTVKSGLAVPAGSTQTAAWADFDNDGFLDLFIGNESTPCQLFHNRGDGTFVDIARPAGVSHSRGTKGVVAGDYDNDGFPDYYVSNMEGENFLYHNNGDGTFTNVAKELHVELPVVSFPTWFFDYNNDGWLDIFVGSDYHSVAEVAKGYLNRPLAAEGCKLYRNTGKGTFEDVSKEAGIDRSFMPMGANFGDFDNDGFLDFYLGTGGPSYGGLAPNVLFKNHQGKYFVDVTTSSGTGSLEKGHGIAFADINNDGMEEIFVHLGGATAADRAAAMIFRPPSNENKWITIHLIGVKSNRSAIGTRIKVTVETSDQEARSIHRVVGSGGSFGTSPLQQHIGLGMAKQIKEIEIQWPTSKTQQTFQNVGMNQFIEIKEFGKSFTVKHHRSFPFKT